ncbi:MAG: PIN domain-containing protein [Clostridiales bacterium]|jgi:tRNA(fMet)-specific endonuclease VapC|nr:PIN domain-containing protein [Clostridiales bacterium]
MIFALDTNIVSYVLRGNESIMNRCESSDNDAIVIPLIVYYEIKRGLISANATTKLTSLNRLCGIWRVDKLTPSDMDTAAQIYVRRKKQGRPMDDADLLIAAQVVSRGPHADNEQHAPLRQQDGLRVVNWAQ